MTFTFVRATVPINVNEGMELEAPDSPISAF